MIFTPSKARLNPIRSQAGGDYNWLFLPGGPGLGSESLKGLTDLLQLPGTMWFLDLPGDGSNLIADDTNAFAHWSQALIEACTILDNVILVAHSMGGMYALSTPELESSLKGLVLIASAPDAGFQYGFAEYVHNNPLPQAGQLMGEHITNPSNETLKAVTIAFAPYVSLKTSHQALVSLLETLPFNCQSNLWSAQHFDHHYQAKWVPQNIPTLIFAGDQDYLTPLRLFEDLPAFQTKNISIKTIPNASHFPWLENPEKVREVFMEYCGSLRP